MNSFISPLLALCLFIPPPPSWALPTSLMYGHLNHFCFPWRSRPALGPEASLSKSVNGGRGTGLGSKENGVPSASNYLESAAYPEVGEGITSPLPLSLSQHTHPDLARSCLLGNLERQGPSPALLISFSESPRMNQSKSGSIFFFS